MAKHFAECVDWVHKSVSTSSGFYHRHPALLGCFPEGLTRLIRDAMSGIDPRTRLSGRVNFRQLRKIYFIRALVHCIPIEGNHKIHVARRVGQRALP
jgi:hypothetical protein